MTVYLSMYIINLSFEVIIFLTAFFLELKKCKIEQEDRASPQCICVNPLSLNIHLQILQSNLYTFPLRISCENLIKDQGIFSLVIILLILITLFLDNVWILLGENWCWSLLGPKGLKNECSTQYCLSIQVPNDNCYVYRLKCGYYFSVQFLMTRTTLYIVLDHKS